MTSQRTHRRRGMVLGMAAVAGLAAVAAQPALAAHPATSDPAASGEDISGTVTFWHAYSADSPEVDTLENTIIPAFEQLHPDVDVQSVPVPYDDLHQKLVTAVAGGELPDLVRSDIIWVPELANLGVLVPLDDRHARLPDATPTRCIPARWRRTCGTATTTACRSTPTPA